MAFGGHGGVEEPLSGQTGASGEQYMYDRGPQDLIPVQEAGAGHFAGGTG